MKDARFAFVEHMRAVLVDRITGRSAVRVDRHPEELFWAGRLSPTSIAKHSAYSYSAPSQIGLEFRIREEDLPHAVIKAEFSGAVFVRVRPTYEEQKQALLAEFRKKYPEFEADCFDDILDIVESGRAVGFCGQVAEVYEKINLVFAAEFWPVDILKGSVGLRVQLETEPAREELLKKADSMDVFPGTREPVYPEDVVNPEAWKCFLERLRVPAIHQNWNFSASAEVRRDRNGTVRIGVYLCNTSPAGRAGRVNSLFDARICIEAEGCTLVPTELKYFADDYKYDRTEPAVGKNCAVRFTGPGKVETEPLPIYRQPRLKTRTTGVVPALAELSRDPFPVLNGVAASMRAELERWRANFEECRSELTEKGRRGFSTEIRMFEEEIERFVKGIQVLERFPPACRAFKLMNLAFSRLAKGYESWHLFQLVFIVSCIPDIVSREHPEIQDPAESDTVDLLHFPTGSGKTEAFLGLTVFAMFFDRIRGKTAGTTALIKFPLRLLSLQQLQRAADVIVQAELVRRSQPDLVESDPFAIGYFVGSESTPNSLIDENDHENWDLAEKIAEQPQEERDRKYLIVERCPFCGQQSVHIDVLRDERRLVHRCTSPECGEDVLPIYIVDYEIYRYLPAVIVSTLDKSALIGIQRRFRNILGLADRRCPVHGYTSLPECIETRKACPLGPDELQEVNLYDPAPTLLIQDELHLVRESLGAFNAHYESFINLFTKELAGGGRPVKVVGATATITDYERQIYHLYHRKARCFPARSPYIGRSFYAEEDREDIGRIIIGAAPFGRTPIHAIQDLVFWYRYELYSYWCSPELVRQIPGLENLTDQEVKELLRDYWVVLEYNQRKNDAMEVVQGASGMVSTDLAHLGIPRLRAETLTGDSVFQDIRDVMSRIEHPQDFLPEVDVVAATSMISHGVDTDRFNFMIFYGMPRSTAEYVQAFSRSGRRHPALIFTVLNYVRERDRSYYHHFVRFNEYKDILVEPVPINRWAARAVERTLPGLFAALVLNYWDWTLGKKGHSAYMLSGFQEALSAGLLPSPEETAGFLIRAYGADTDNWGAAYRDRILREVKQIYQRLADLKCGPFGDQYLTEALNKIGFPVMRSLRDTDIPVQVVMPEPDAEIARRVAYSRK